MSFLGFTSIRLGLCSVLPKDTHMKMPEDREQLKPGTNILPLSHAGPLKTCFWYQNVKSKVEFLKLKNNTFSVLTLWH